VGLLVASEKEKMLAGELYNPLDDELSQARGRARRLCRMLNATRDDETAERARILGELLSRTGAGLSIEPPFYCDYGTNITLGEKVFFNFNCVILDPAQVVIGDRVLFGPAVQIYTAMHPLSAEERQTGLEYAKPVSIESDVWIGGAAVICPGVSVGARSVIGAGSVVTRDVPTDVFAAGNPCRIIREL